MKSGWKSVVIICFIMLFVACQKQQHEKQGKRAQQSPSKIVKDEIQEFLDNKGWILEEETPTEEGANLIYVREVTKPSDEGGEPLVTKWRKEVKENLEGQIILLSIHVNDKPLYYFEWYDSGNLKNKVKYDSSGNVIENMQFYEDGSKFQEWFFTGKSKTVKTWNNDGSLTQEDVLDAKGKYVSSKRWYDDGTLKYEGTFKDGKPMIRKFYKPDGSLEKKVFQ